MNFNIDVSFDIFLLIAAILAYQFAKYQILFQKKSEVYADLYEKWVDYVASISNLRRRKRRGSSVNQIIEICEKNSEIMSDFFILYQKSSLFISKALDILFRGEIRRLISFNNAYIKASNIVKSEGLNNILESEKAIGVVNSDEIINIEETAIDTIVMNNHEINWDNPIISQMRKELNNNLIDKILEKIKYCKNTTI